MSRKKRQQEQFEDVPVDKVDLFLAQNYKKLLIGFAVILVVFVAGYAFKNISKSKGDMLANKLGQLEMLMTMSGGADEQVGAYVKMADEYPKAGDYISLKAGELLVEVGSEGDAEPLLTQTGGEFKELADGLKFDTGMGSVNPEQYMTTGRMSALWHYRAWLAADDAKKAEILESFKTKFPENELLKQIERWNG